MQLGRMVGHSIKERAAGIRALRTRVGDSLPLVLSLSGFILQNRISLNGQEDGHPQPSFTYFQFRNPNKESFFSLRSIYLYHQGKRCLLALFRSSPRLCQDIRYYNWPSCAQESIWYKDCHPPLEPQGGQRAGFPKGRMVSRPKQHMCSATSDSAFVSRNWTSSIDSTWAPVRNAGPQAPAQNQTAF